MLFSSSSCNRRLIVVSSEAMGRKSPGAPAAFFLISHFSEALLKRLIYGEMLQSLDVELPPDSHVGLRGERGDNKVSKIEKKRKQVRGWRSDSRPDLFMSSLRHAPRQSHFSWMKFLAWQFQVHPWKTEARHLVCLGRHELFPETLPILKWSGTRRTFVSEQLLSVAVSAR